MSQSPLQAGTCLASADIIVPKGRATENATETPQKRRFGDKN